MHILKLVVGGVWENLRMSTFRLIRDLYTGPVHVARARRAMASVFCMITCWLITVSAAGAADTNNDLIDIEVQSLPGNRLELRLMFSDPAPEPLSFTIDDPARIAIDLQSTGLDLASRRKDVGIGVLDTILAAEANGRTRVVLNLDVMVPYETRVADNSIYVTLGSLSTGMVNAESSAVVVGAQKTAATQGNQARGGRDIDDIDFRRTENGAGRLIVSLSNVGTPIDVRRSGGQVILSLSGTSLPDDLMKRLDVIDFATPVNTIDVMRVGDDTRIVIAATGQFEELAYQSDTVFTVEVQPIIKEEKPNKEATLFSANREYTGDRLTLNFQDIDTRAVLQLLADVSGRNIVVSDTVVGNVTLRLQSVPWDQALDIVLATKGLDMRENGNVIIVAPAAEIAQRELADLESRKEIKELEPLTAEYLQVNYAKAGDLASLIEGDGGNALISERGSVSIDERTNTLLVQDTSDRISDIRTLVATLDIPVRQVLIESRIVIVRDDFARDLGIRWGATVVSDTSNGLNAITGNAGGTNTIVNSAIDNINNTGQPFPVDVPDLDDRFMVNVPVASPAGSLALAILNDDFLIDLELSAVQAEGRGEVISSPRVITANQKEANIKQGVEIPYQESASSGATTTQFKEAVLSLTVTPQITPDDRLIMDLVVTKDSVGEVITTERGGAVPSIDTRSIETQVLVNNGQTVVLGGIYETEQGETVTKVPFLGDIPGLGVFFRSTRIVSNKSELLIFVTPKILKEGSSIY
jgi:type IV pilus assembly protein PilQ